MMKLELHSVIKWQSRARLRGVFFRYGLLASCLLSFGLNYRAQAEAPNPFGDIGQTNPNAGQPGNAPPDEMPADGGFGFPAPGGNDQIPPAPPANNDFNANNPFGGNAGMPSPSNPQNEPPPLAAPPTAMPAQPPTPNARPSRAGRSSTPDSTKGPKTPGSTVTVVGDKSKPAQKLADYLELDSSVKGLEVKNFDLPDKDIRDVVTLISKWTGKNFILDNKVRGKITIIGPSQVTLQEAYNAFLSALEANGLTTVQSGKFIRIIESAEARRAPVKTYSGDYAPKDDQFITRIFQLKYINADEVSREFRDLVTRQGKLFAYEPTNSIIITDTGSNIQRIRDILDALDVKNFETTLHVLRIKNGSAKTIADMLGEIYGEPRGGGGNQGGGTRSFRRSALERTRGGGIISKIIPDDQTNSLIILANAAGYTLLERLVARLDVKVTDTGRIHVYYCEYAKAEDLASTLASLSGGGSGGKSSSRKTSVSTPAANSPTGAPQTTGTAASGSSSSGPVSAELEDGVKITSDSSTNSLVIIASSSAYKTLRRVLKKLDIPRLQVFVETAILEVALTHDTNIKVNAALGAPGARGFAGGFIGDSASIGQFITGNVVEGATIPIFAGPTFQGQVNGATVPVNTFMGLLNFLTTNTDTSILSTPQIIALDNEKATFKVQDEIPVLSSVVLNPTGTGSNSALGTGSVTTLKTGIEINLTPQVNAASRTVRLAIEQTVDTLKASGDVPALLAQANKAKTTRITNTTVVVRDQDYVMLGGLMSDQVDETERKVPLLGDIPILGWLFKGRQVTTKKTNLVILLRPRIIGTTLAASNLINEKLKSRDEYIDRFSSHGEQHEQEVGKIRDSIVEQEKRGKKEPVRDYRNNEETDEDNADSKISSDPGPRPGTSPTNGSFDLDEQPLLPQQPGGVPLNNNSTPGGLPNGNPGGN
jgi:general secretion pathway protein D